MSNSLCKLPKIIIRGAVGATGNIFTEMPNHLQNLLKMHASDLEIIPIKTIYFEIDKIGNYSILEDAANVIIEGKTNIGGLSTPVIYDLRVDEKIMFLPPPTLWESSHFSKSVNLLSCLRGAPPTLMIVNVMSGTRKYNIPCSKVDKNIQNSYLDDGTAIYQAMITTPYEFMKYTVNFDIRPGANQIYSGDMNVIFYNQEKLINKNISTPYKIPSEQPNYVMCRTSDEFCAVTASSCTNEECSISVDCDNILIRWATKPLILARIFEDSVIVEKYIPFKPRDKLEIVILPSSIRSLSWAEALNVPEDSLISTTYKVTTVCDNGILKIDETGIHMDSTERIGNWFKNPLFVEYTVGMVIELTFVTGNEKPLLHIDRLCVAEPFKLILPPKHNYITSSFMDEISVKQNILSYQCDFGTHNFSVLYEYGGEQRTLTATIHNIPHKPVFVKQETILVGAEVDVTNCYISGKPVREMYVQYQKLYYRDEQIENVPRMLSCQNNKLISAEPGYIELRQPDRTLIEIRFVEPLKSRDFIGIGDDNILIPGIIYKTNLLSLDTISIEDTTITIVKTDEGYVATADGNFEPAFIDNVYIIPMIIETIAFKNQQKIIGTLPNNIVASSGKAISGNAIISIEIDDGIITLNLNDSLVTNVYNNIVLYGKTTYFGDKNNKEIDGPLCALRICFLEEIPSNINFDIDHIQNVISLNAPTGLTTSLSTLPLNFGHVRNSNNSITIWLNPSSGRNQGSSLISLNLYSSRDDQVQRAFWTEGLSFTIQLTLTWDYIIMPDLLFATSNPKISLQKNSRAILTDMSGNLKSSLVDTEIDLNNAINNPCRLWYINGHKLITQLVQSFTPSVILNYETLVGVPVNLPGNSLNYYSSWNEVDISIKNDTITVNPKLPGIYTTLVESKLVTLVVYAPKINWNCTATSENNSYLIPLPSEAVASEINIVSSPMSTYIVDKDNQIINLISQASSAIIKMGMLYTVSAALTTKKYTLINQTSYSGIINLKTTLKIFKEYQIVYLRINQTKAVSISDFTPTRPIHFVYGTDYEINDFFNKFYTVNTYGLSNNKPLFCFGTDTGNLYYKTYYNSHYEISVAARSLQASNFVSYEGTMQLGINLGTITVPKGLSMSFMLDKEKVVIQSPNYDTTSNLSINLVPYTLPAITHINNYNPAFIEHIATSGLDNNKFGIYNFDSRIYNSNVNSNGLDAFTVVFRTEPLKFIIAQALVAVNIKNIVSDQYLKFKDSILISLKSGVLTSLYLFYPQLVKVDISSVPTKYEDVLITIKEPAEISIELISPDGQIPFALAWSTSAACGRIILEHE